MHLALAPGTRSSLILEGLAILELDDDQFCVASDVFRKMDVGVSAPHYTPRGQNLPSCPIGNLEIEVLVGQENSAIRGMCVHDGFLALTVPNSKNADQLILKRHGVVPGIRHHSIWECWSSALGHHTPDEAIARATPRRTLRISHLPDQDTRVQAAAAA